MTHKDHLPAHDQREISIDDMHAFTEKVRQVAPYTNQEIDGFGSYVTNFAFGDEDYISIYVPIAPELANEDTLIDDAVRVLIRMENPLGDGRSIVTTKSYIVHELDGEANYSEKSRVHDTETGECLDTYTTPSLEELRSILTTNQQLGTNIFTYERLTEVMGILDMLRPEDIFPA